MPFRSYLLSFLTLAAVTFSSCSKDKGTSNAKPEEELLKISLANVVENEYTASPGDTYTFQIKITSAMPTGGVNIVVTVVTDAANVPVPQNSVAPSTNGTIDVTLIGLKPIQTMKVTVVVTSVDNTSNTATKTFWITNKEAQ